MDVPALEVGAADLVHCVNENVNSLVSVFVSATDADENGIFGYRHSRHRRGDLPQSEPRGRTLGGILLLRRRSEAVLEAVRRHHVDFPAEEMTAFFCGNLAHCREYVCVLRRLCLQGMESHHIELPCLFVRVVCIHRFIQPHVVAGETTSHDSGVSRKDSSNRQTGVFQIQESRSRLPFVELGDDLVGCVKEELAVALDHLSGHIAEEG